jgi:hypothetical protein
VGEAFARVVAGDTHVAPTPDGETVVLGEDVRDADGPAPVPDGKALTDMEGVTDAAGVALTMVATTVADGNIVAVTNRVGVGAPWLANGALEVVGDGLIDDEVEALAAREVTDAVELVISGVFDGGEALRDGGCVTDADDGLADTTVADGVACTELARLVVEVIDCAADREGMAYEVVLVDGDDGGGGLIGTALATMAT